MTNKLTLGFSPCPNDCFIFDALIHKKIDTDGLEFEVVMTDVEDLNKHAFSNKINITKLSYHAFMHLVNNYVLLDAGSALGFGCGPLLICKMENGKWKMGDETSSISHLTPSINTVAIPGKNTTANFLFSLAFPQIKNKKEMKFSEIEDAVLKHEVDAGVIIHENRFTYEQKGLKKIIDLGEYWEKLTNSPIPLGGIVAQRSMDIETTKKVNKLIRKSVEYAFANPKASLSFVKEHAQEMSEEVMYKHIDLYVNKFSINLGIEGRKAVETMFKKGIEVGIIKQTSQKIFID